ncbi:MAG: hypothetical protein QOE18_148 [Chloroflexota bacterium]|nr:hypothetical protein [Chloroflexota bacterium]
MRSCWKQCAARDTCFVPLPRLLRTASFRLSALYAVLFGGCVLLLAAAAFWGTRSSLEQQLTRRIEAETMLLEQEFRSKGIDGLIATVQQRTSVNGTLDYFVVDAAGKRLAGDLPITSDRLGWVETDSGQDAGGRPNSDNETVRALVTELDGGFRLGVGEDLEQVGEMEETFLGILGSALGIVLVLGIGGGLLLSAAFLRRVDMITRTADAIIEGDLSRRIERTGSGDDFDHLSATLNAMLDRIAGLMENLRQVSNDIAHDLRTPLSRLRQDLEEAQKRDLTASDFKRVIDGAVAEADMLLETFSALLRIAQIEAGTRRSAFRPVDLSEVARTVAEAYAPAVEESGRTLRAEIADGVQVNGDRGLLSQLFVNLVENALHHTPPGTTIALRLSRQPAGALAEIADTGAGIPTDERFKVFRRFYRLERSRTTPGSGLGLSMVAAIVELHHAAIELLDNEPGLRVMIRFP